jgi:polygalacturonase
MYEAKRRGTASIIAAGLVAVLCLAVAVQAQQPPASGARTYNIRDYGAVGDGKALDSPAINRAIEACTQAGGGTVWVSSGTYLSGSIRMKSNTHLYLDAGAVILGAPQDMNVYDPAERFEGKAYQDGGHTYFHNSLIWGENLVNISITGPGMINGGGLTTGVERNSGIQIMGMPEQPIEGVRLDNIRLEFQGGGTEQDAAIVPKELDTGYPEPRGTMPSYGVFARHVRGLEMSNIRVSFEKEDRRPPMVCVDVDGLEIDNFKAQVAQGVTAARFEQVKGLVVRNSPVLEGLAAK